MSTMTRERILKAHLDKNPFATKDEVRQALYDAEPQVSTGAIRGWLNRQFDDGEAPWDRVKVCPRCQHEAHGAFAIREDFGLRYGGTQPQSYCKECR